MTTPLKHLQPLLDEARAAAAAGLPSELTMLLRRLHVYKFSVKARAPPQQLKPCASCFASLVLEGEAYYSQGSS